MTKLIKKFIDALESHDHSKSLKYAKELEGTDPKKITDYIFKYSDDSSKFDFVVLGAAQLGHLDIMKLLVHYVKNSDCSEFEHSIKDAAENGHTEMVRFLLDNDFEISEHSYPLYYACNNEHYDTVDLLLSRGVKFDDDDKEIKMQYKMFKINQRIRLLSNLKPINYEERIKKLNEKLCEVAKYFLNKNDNKQLNLEVKYGNLNTVKLLIDNNTILNNSWYDSPLGIAAEYGHLDIIKYLMDNGSDIHNNNDYALYVAARRGHAEVVMLLLEYGANPSSDNYRSIKAATENKHIDVVRLLEIIKQ